MTQQGQSGVRRSRYESADGTAIVLEVPEPPMGVQSGYIPPPVIEFFHRGATVQFGYRGEERDRA